MKETTNRRQAKLTGWLFCVFFCLFVLGPESITAAEAEKQQNKAGPADKNAAQKYVSMDFNEVELSVFIKFISEITGKNFIIDEKVRDKVTIISPSKISIKEAYQVFASVLEVHGYTTVESGEVTKIVKAVDARTKSVATGLADASEGGEDKVVTRIIPLTYANPDEVKQLLVPLVSKTGVLLSYPSTNMLILTDTQSNIRRLMKIIDVIDVTGMGQKVTVIPLEYADAKNLVSVLEKVFQDEKAKRRRKTGQGIELIADERANAIVVLATKAETDKIRELAEHLDKEIPKGKERIHVYYLKHADAEELADVLMNLPEGKQKSSGGAARAPVISEDVNITADSATNSLIITAERDDYAVLQDIIQKLDIPRSMVYIECLIAEVNVDREFNLGAEWLFMGEGAYKDKEGGWGGGFGGGSETGYSNTAALVQNGTLPPGFSVGAFSEAIEIGGVTFPNLAAIVQAYRKDKDVHILSTPQIMTTNNSEASITIGKNIPYLTRMGTTESVDTYSNYEYKDVGISLKIKPQINENRLIRLDLTQEVTRLDQTTTASPERPATMKRAIETNVIVHDNHTIVIGGLIDDSMSQIEYRVPCLGEVPLLGWLFKSFSDGRQKTNLFVFLTPHVVKSFEDAETVVDEKKSSVDELMESDTDLFPKSNGKHRSGERGDEEQSDKKAEKPDAAGKAEDRGGSAEAGDSSAEKTDKTEQAPDKGEKETGQKPLAPGVNGAGSVTIPLQGGSGSPDEPGKAQNDEAAGADESLEEGQQ